MGPWHFFFPAHLDSTKLWSIKNKSKNTHCHIVRTGGMFCFSVTLLVLWKQTKMCVLNNSRCGFCFCFCFCFFFIFVLPRCIVNQRPTSSFHASALSKHNVRLARIKGATGKGQRVSCLDRACPWFPWPSSHVDYTHEELKQTVVVLKRRNQYTKRREEKSSQRVEAALLTKSSELG